MKTDTIAAVATAMSDSGIGIIRVSGEEAIEIVNRIYRSKSGRKSLCDVASHTINYGYIVDNSGNDIDEVMVSVMKSPNSYTTEDTVEINCHGGVFMVNRILETVIKNGARIAEPGEFTKRAFLNGRIDLSKAEAVIDIIHSKNQFALKNSVSQLKGSVSDTVCKLRDEIIYEIAFIESALDDPEHISLDGYRENLYEKVEDIIVKLKKLLDSADNSKMLKEGINTVIVGKPNAGKSSLLNLLVGEEKAIVTDIAGTTRDVLEESIRLHGISLNIIDTAGIRYTEDVVEKIGVERAKKYASDADLIIYVVDASVPLDESDYDIMSMISGKKLLILLNKTDLDEVVTEELLLYEMKNLDINSNMNNSQIIKTSTKDNIGIDLLEQAIKDMFFHGEILFNDEVFITNMRHKEAIMNAYKSMLQVKRSLEDDMPEDFYSIDLMSAYSSLGEIIGEEVEEDLVNEIFSKFCMGK
ncbi:MAG: tRNA uridine-5-carboxymethylaminomethyl(34) synthesis GTPase MnmE [Clostridiales bacterium]|nr:tRNA uridine-5-carboxymethylaminomethyl(34) synthesis GTPase MnmE [Clostridiales bacterium]